jgi:hypothetical protein
MLPETPDPTLPLFAEIASLKSALAAVQDAYTEASLELLAMQRVGLVGADDTDSDETAAKPDNNDETRWGQLEVD